MKKNQIFAKVRKGVLLLIGMMTLFTILDCSGQKPKESSSEEDTQAITLSQSRAENVVLDIGVSEVTINEGITQDITYSWKIKKKMEDLDVEGYLFSLEVLDNQGNIVLSLQNKPLEDSTFTIDSLSTPEESLPYEMKTSVELVTSSATSFTLTANSQTLLYSDGVMDVDGFRIANASMLIDSICAMDTMECAYITLFDSSLQNADSTVELSNYMLYNIYNLAEIQGCICDDDIISNIDSLFDCLSGLIPVVQSTVIQTTVSQDSSILCNLL